MVQHISTATAHPAYQPLYEVHHPLVLESEYEGLKLMRSHTTPVGIPLVPYSHVVYLARPLGSITKKFLTTNFPSGPPCCCSSCPMRYSPRSYGVEHHGVRQRRRCHFRARSWHSRTNEGREPSSRQHGLRYWHRRTQQRRPRAPPHRRPCPRARRILPRESTTSDRWDSRPSPVAIGRCTPRGRRGCTVPPLCRKRRRSSRFPRDRRSLGRSPDRFARHYCRRRHNTLPFRHHLPQ
mmetsp:Transcript_2681/g.6700  ORF Transcript_2681/g.6700 Transcript_2681/m.6700 type:complete len:237 (-) Transcript_2681:1071-1781(-)